MIDRMHPEGKIVPLREQPGSSSPLFSRRTFLGGCVGLGVLALPVGWYSFIYEPRDIEVVRHTMVIRNLPSRLDGMTAVQISDLHLRKAEAVHFEMLDKVRALQPDLIVVTGDLVDHPTAAGDLLELFRSLDAAYGIWAVPGNREHSAKAISLLQRLLEPTVLRFLINESAQIAGGLWLVGVDDPASRHDRLEDALYGVPARVPRILLAHSPDIARSLTADKHIDLTLAGHTHGGQVNLPFFNGARTHDALYPQYLRGFYRVSNSPMYVNRGIGTTGLPVRIGSRPEVTHFTFRAA
jgi:predicted MPP superfamily phosphohydrolase